MSDIIADLRELRTQLATVLDDEIILGVLDRAASEIEEHRNGCKSYLAWGWSYTKTALTAESHLQDDDSPLLYSIRWNPTEQRWFAAFEGACVCRGALSDCMKACEEEETIHIQEEK